jgi:hypothetical protein
VALLFFANSSIYAAERCERSTEPLPLDNAFGVNIDFTEPQPGEMRMMAAAGIRWVRMDLKWDVTETQPGRYDFSAYDRLLKALDGDRVRALFILDYGNPLYDDGAPPRTERSRKAFVRWAVAAARHFSNRGVLWELYNEPNHEQFWPPKPNVADYVLLAVAVGKAFKESVPDERLIGPATAGVDFEFLEECFKRGVLDYFWAVSVHPYRREDPETATADYCRLRRLIEKYSRRTVPIISSEWGYSRSWPTVSSTKQSELLVRSWLTNVANGVQLSIWYDWRDDGSDKSNPEHNFGTVGHVYQSGAQPFETKPAYVAVSNLNKFLAGYNYQRRLMIGSEEEHLLVFQRGSDTRMIAWTTSSEKRRVVLPFIGSFSLSDYLGRSSSSKLSQGSLMIELSNAPLFVSSIQ